MRQTTIKFATAAIALLLCVAMISAVSAKAYDSAKSSDDKNARDSYWAATQKAMGVEGKQKPDNAITFEIPMTTKVILDKIELNQASDRSHDFDFQKAGNKAIMVGEIGVTDNQVKDVTKMTVQSGLKVTAIHNHLVRLSPHIIWIHISGSGDPVDLAKKIRSITDYVNGEPPVKSEEKFDSKGISTSRLDKVIGNKGTAEGGDYNFDIERADKVNMNGTVLSPEMDISTMIRFQPVGNGKAAVMGEFVLEANEVEPVMQTFLDNGIEVTALHSHMLTEQPRLFYIHCWSTGNAEDLAIAMRKALDRTNSKIRS